MKFLRNCWYVAGYPEELTEAPLARTLLGEAVVLYRGSNGQPVALADACPHRFAPLSMGKVVGDAIRCPYHGLQFGARGECVLVPSGDQAPPRAKVRHYPLEERHSLVWIWMGDVEKASAAKIPDFAYLEDRTYGWFDGYIHAKANYQLIVDNLLDLSHAEFLHPMLSSDGWGARNQQTIEQGEDSITVLNIAEDDNILPITQMAFPDLPKLGKTVQIERWTVPGHMKLSIEYYAGGVDVIIPSAHFATPETGYTSHYFTRSGQGWDPGNPEVTAAVGAGVQHIFQTEDIGIIEAQQEFLGRADLMDREPAVLRNDNAALRARRLLAKHIRLEPDSANALGEVAA